MTLTVGSLFSGIGGIDLGLERAGMTVRWHSEIDPYACQVLKKHWPDIPNLGDITRVDWKEVPYVDVIAGGYPCQPFSLAGKRNGENDPRHLWPFFRDAISVLRPRYALLENVRGHLTLGGLSVIGDLASIGYDAEWRVISAASVGANHRRDRLIIVTYPNGSDESDVSVNGRRQKNVGLVANTDGGDTSDGRQRPALSCEGRSRGNDGGGSRSHSWEIGVEEPRENPGDVADSESRTNRHDRKNIRKALEQKYPSCDEGCDCGESGESGHRENVADTNAWEIGRWFGGDGTTEREVFSRGNIGSGISKYDGREWWQTEPDVGRVAHGVPSRVDRLKGLGNAVVPQVAEVVGRLIMEHAQ